MQDSLKNIITLSFFCLSLTACGGGGGGGGGGIVSQSSITLSSAASSPASSATTESSLSNSSFSADAESSKAQSSSSSSLSNQPPSATVIFPTQDASVANSNLLVRGTAWDDDNIKRVLVNGQEASMVTWRRDENANLHIEWEALIDLKIGNTILDVTVEDDQGVITTAANSGIELHNLRIPTLLLDDKANSRILGIDYDDNGIAINKNTNEITRIKPRQLPIDSVVSKDGSTIYSAALYYGLHLELTATDVNSGSTVIIEKSALQFDTNIWSWGSLTDSAYSVEKNILYLLIKFFPKTDSNQNLQNIYAYDLTTKKISLLAHDVNAGNYLSSISNIAFAGDKLLITGGSNYFEESLWSIHLTSGQKEKILSFPSASAMNLTTDSTYLNVYIAGMDSIITINLSSLKYRKISDNSINSSLPLSQIHSVIVNEKDNHLIITDSTLQDAIKVDINTGTRSNFIANGRGTGPKLIAPREIVATSDSKSAYVFDDGGNASSRLFHVDLKSGNRTLIQLVHANEMSTVNGLALDESNKRLFIAGYNTIAEIDLINNSEKIIMGTGIGSGAQTSTVNGLVYDSINNRLLFNGLNQIISIDLATLNRHVLFDTTLGDGPIIKGYFGFVLDYENNRILLLSSRENGGLYSIDLQTGKRSLLLDKCFDNYGNDQLTKDSTRINMNYNTKLNRIVANGNWGILNFDMSNTTCSAVIPPNLTTLDLELLDNETLIQSTFAKLNIVDKRTGKIIEISR